MQVTFNFDNLGFKTCIRIQVYFNILKEFENVLQPKKDVNLRNMQMLILEHQLKLKEIIMLKKLHLL